MSFDKKSGLYNGYIYKITNNINGKIYIGQTITNIQHRFKQHITKSKQNYNYAICCAIRKYGEENFSIEEIDKVEKPNKQDLINALNELEILRIKEYQSLTNENGYNIDIGGGSCSYFSKQIDVYDLYGNLIHTFDSGHETARYYDIDVNTVFNICNGTQNRCLKHDVIFRYMNEPFNKYDTTLLLPNTKTLYQFTTDGEYVGEYISAPKAVEELDLNISPTCLSHAARLNKISCGYVWSYEKEFKFDIENYRNYVSVDKYSTDGKFLGNFKCVTDAGKSLNLDYVKTSCITDVCSGKMLTAYGYVWRYKNEPFDKYRVVSKYQSVNQYSKDNIFIETHVTANQAAKKVGIKCSSDIGKCCKGKQKTCGGFKWFYADDPNQPDKSKIIA